MQDNDDENGANETDTKPQSPAPARVEDIIDRNYSTLTDEKKADVRS